MCVHIFSYLYHYKVRRRYFQLIFQRIIIGYDLFYIIQYNNDPFFLLIYIFVLEARKKRKKIIGRLKEVLGGLKRGWGGEEGGDGGENPMEIIRILWFSIPDDKTMIQISLFIFLYSYFNLFIYFSL